MEDFKNANGKVVVVSEDVLNKSKKLFDKCQANSEFFIPISQPTNNNNKRLTHATKKRVQFDETIINEILLLQKIKTIDNDTQTNRKRTRISKIYKQFPIEKISHDHNNKIMSPIEWTLDMQETAESLIDDDTNNKKGKWSNDLTGIDFDINSSYCTGDGNKTDVLTQLKPEITESVQILMHDLSEAVQSFQDLSEPKLTDPSTMPSLKSTFWMKFGYTIPLIKMAVLRKYPVVHRITEYDNDIPVYTRYGAKHKTKEREVAGKELKEWTYYVKLMVVDNDDYINDNINCRVGFLTLERPSQELLDQIKEGTVYDFYNIKSLSHIWNFGAETLIQQKKFNIQLSNTTQRNNTRLCRQVFSVTELVKYRPTTMFKEVDVLGIVAKVDHFKNREDSVTLFDGESHVIQVVFSLSIKKCGFPVFETGSTLLLRNVEWGSIHHERNNLYAKKVTSCVINPSLNTIEKIYEDTCMQKFASFKQNVTKFQHAYRHGIVPSCVNQRQRKENWALAKRTEGMDVYNNSSRKSQKYQLPNTNKQQKQKAKTSLFIFDNNV